MPSGGGQSGGGGTVGLPGGSGRSGGGLPGGGLPGGGLPGGGIPGGGVPLPSPGIPGPSGTGSGDGSGNSGRPGSPGAEFPTAGDIDGDGIPDTAQPGNPGDDVDFSEGTASSREEQVAALDEELEGSMRDYDGRILEERAGVMGRANQRGAEQQLEDFDRSLEYYEEGDLNDDDVSTEDKEMPENAAPPSGEPGLPTSGRTKDVNTPPDDIPSGNDDDVLERQMRQAAMEETDPELREKLWDEYRKLKNRRK